MIAALIPALKNIPVTHRWGGFIHITQLMHRVSLHHAHHKNILALSGHSGHGVALSDFVRPSPLAQVGYLSEDILCLAASYH